MCLEFFTSSFQALCHVLLTDSSMIYGLPTSLSFNKANFFQNIFLDLSMLALNLNLMACCCPRFGGSYTSIEEMGSTF